MTTEANDELLDRKIKYPSAEQEGISPVGFSDASFQYPAQQYENSSGINFSAQGISSYKLSYSGGTLGNSIPGLSPEVNTSISSAYPYVQVKVSESGHVIELNDTPGAERVLIMHNNGSGVELRPDGSIIVSTKEHKVEVVGGDNTVIVEGNANLTYKGNLTLNVTGDFNVNCLNYNVNARGDKTEYIGGKEKRSVSEDYSENISGNKKSTVVGTHTQTHLADYSVTTKMKYSNIYKLSR